MDKTTRKALLMGAAGLVQGTANTYMQNKENTRKEEAMSKRDKALHMQAMAMAEFGADRADTRAEVGRTHAENMQEDSQEFQTQKAADAELSSFMHNGVRLTNGAKAKLEAQGVTDFKTVAEHTTETEKKTLDKTIAAEKRTLDNSILKALMAQGSMDKKEAKKIRNDAYDDIFEILNDPAKRFQYEQMYPGKTANEMADLYVANIVKLKTGVDVSAAASTTKEASVSVDATTIKNNVDKKIAAAGDKGASKEVGNKSIRNVLFGATPGKREGDPLTSTKKAPEKGLISDDLERRRVEASKMWGASGRAFGALWKAVKSIGNPSEQMKKLNEGAAPAGFFTAEEQKLIDRGVPTQKIIDKLNSLIQK